MKVKKNYRNTDLAEIIAVLDIRYLKNNMYWSM